MVMPLFFLFNLCLSLRECGIFYVMVRLTLQTRGRLAPTRTVTHVHTNQATRHKEQMVRKLKSRNTLTNWHKLDQNGRPPRVTRTLNPSTLIWHSSRLTSCVGRVGGSGKVDSSNSSKQRGLFYVLPNTRKGKKNPFVWVATVNAVISPYSRT